MDCLRMPERDVAIDLAMNQQHRCMRISDGVLRRNLLHIEPELPTRSKKCDFDQRP